MRKNALSGRGPAYLVVCLALLVLLGFSILAAVSFGTMSIPMGDVYRVIIHELFGWETRRSGAAAASTMWCGSSACPG